MEPNGDGYSLSNFDRQMRDMKDRMASMLDLMLKQHELVMEEIRGSSELQKEHRVDIMALFQLAKKPS